MIDLIVNGAEFELNGSGVTALLEQLGADAERVALMVNDAVIPRAEWADCRLTAGDRIEVLSFAAGG